MANCSRKYDFFFLISVEYQTKDDIEWGPVPMHCIFTIHVNSMISIEVIYVANSDDPKIIIIKNHFYVNP